MRCVTVNFKKVLPATQQISFTKCDSARALPFGCHGASDTSAAPSLLLFHHRILGEVSIVLHALVPSGYRQINELCV